MVMCDQVRAYYQTRNNIHDHEHIHIYSIYVCHDCFSNSNPMNTINVYNFIDVLTTMLWPLSVYSDLECTLVGAKVKVWNEEITQLSIFTESLPQAAYSAFTHGFFSK